MEPVDSPAEGALSLAQTLERARLVIRMEAQAVAALEDRVGDQFAGAVEAILAAPGRVIVAGIGKSGIIGRKLASTLTSTGTPASFLHPVEALHGDLGIVGSGDVAILLSKSGQSEELRGLMEYLGRMGVRTVAMTGRVDSALARHAEFVLDCSVAEEACPHDLAPTSSTTATVPRRSARRTTAWRRVAWGGSAGTSSATITSRTRSSSRRPSAPPG
jgi:arabinose-5-phosphate isomerase